MGLRINTNLASINAQRGMFSSGNELRKSLSRLSSGQRIINSGDDAAGLAVSTKMSAQIRSTRQATRNANDAIGVVQTAEGGMNEISNMLIRIRELSIQSATDTLGDNERAFVDKEVQQLKSEIDRIADSTTFNGRKLLQGGDSESVLHFQVGHGSGDENIIGFDLGRVDVKTDTLGVDGVDLRTRDNAIENIDVIDEALNTINQKRAELGATQNRLQSSVRNLRIYHENLSASRSRIMDTDMAEESSNLTKQSILQSAGVSTLIQANQVPKSALRLLA
jgi:flagellin